MKRIIGILVGAMAIVTMASSCSAYTHTLNAERRKVSQTGVELASKSASVSFVESNPKDSTFMSEVADNFALSLENEYFNGASAIELFDIKATEGANYSSRDTLVQLCVSTDSDVAFLFDQPEISSENGVDTLMKFNVYIYDSLGEAKDSVQSFTCKKMVSSYFDTPAEIGQLLAKYFAPQWVVESISIYYFDSDEWLEPANLADEFKWNEAMDKWLTLTNTKNSGKRAVASYNIAVCCYMLGNYDYAWKWLSRCAEDGDVPNAPSMRRRCINAMAN